MQVGPPGPATSPQPAPQPLDQGVTEEQLNIDRLLETTNIAEHLSEDKLKEIGTKVIEGYKLDKESKRKWDDDVDAWIKLAAQIKENRTWPWPRASNVKYPLLSTAAMQFAARAYPALVPADGKVVQMKVVGSDPMGQKANLADKLAKHMNFQLLEDMPDWEEEMDKLLIQLPVIGCLFKKTYFDDVVKSSRSCLLGPKDLIVNYWARSLEDASRVTEVLQMTKNDIATMKAAGLYLDVDLGDPSPLATLRPTTFDVVGNVQPATPDDTTPYILLEQHRYEDLDDDGYAEPYIVTVDEAQGRVLRIVARWDSDGISKNAKGDVVCIKPVGYFTKFGFLPNPDGGFYDIGFGHLLGPLNEAANSIINQLVDAGTLSNLQSGFMGKGLRTKQGETRLAPGEWRHVNATGDDLRKQIVPLPANEPSDVLFKLLGLVIESTEKLASVAEIFVGKMPGQNTPATTTMATIEQGMKVFTAIYKRVYRSLTKEYKKIFRLNSIYEENIKKALHVLDEPIVRTDYDEKAYNVCPTADPTAVSSTQKLLKAQGLMELLQLGTLNPIEVTKRILDAQEQPNPEALLRQGPPPPDPKTQQIQMQMQADQESHQADMALTKLKVAQEAMKLENEKHRQAMDNHRQAMQDQLDQMKVLVGFMQDEAKHKQDLAHEAQSHAQDMVHGEQDHAMKLKQGDEAHKAKLQQQKEKPSAKKGTSS